MADAEMPDVSGSGGPVKDDKTSQSLCLQCFQEFGQLDTFAPPHVEANLRCSKYKCNPKTQKRNIPNGTECYPCEADVFLMVGVFKVCILLLRLWVFVRYDSKYSSFFMLMVCVF